MGYEDGTGSEPCSVTGFAIKPSASTTSVSEIYQK